MTYSPSSSPSPGSYSPRPSSPEIPAEPDSPKASPSPGSDLSPRDSLRVELVLLHRAMQRILARLEDVLDEM